MNNSRENGSKQIVQFWNNKNIWHNEDSPPRWYYSMTPKKSEIMVIHNQSLNAIEGVPFLGSFFGSLCLHFQILRISCRKFSFILVLLLFCGTWNDWIGLSIHVSLHSTFVILLCVYNKINSKIMLLWGYAECSQEQRMCTRVLKFACRFSFWICSIQDETYFCNKKETHNILLIDHSFNYF